MEIWIRRLRGIVGSGVMWAGLWAVIGAVLAVVFGLSTALPLSAEVIFNFATGSAVFGGLAGMSFGFILSSTQGRKALPNLSLLSAGSIGLVGGLLAPVLFWAVGLMSMPVGLFASLSVTTGLLGALVATTTVAIAKRTDETKLPAESSPIELLPGPN